MRDLAPSVGTAVVEQPGAGHLASYGGGRWDVWASKLGEAPAPNTQAAITAAIRFYATKLDEIVVDWDRANTRHPQVWIPLRAAAWSSHAYRRRSSQVSPAVISPCG